MSLHPVLSIQECSECGKKFVFEANTLDVPLFIKCNNCKYKIGEDKETL